MKRTSTLLALLLATTTLSSWAQQLFTNGPIATGATSKSGVAAPTGTQWSEAQNDAGVTTISNTNAGYAASQTLGYDLADDFVVPAGQRWTVNSFSFPGYQTGAAATPSPFLSIYLRVWNGQPGTAGATVIYGDDITNRLGTPTDALTYRIFNSLYPTASAPGTTRKVWDVVATVSPALVLQPGTYWVSWASATTSGAVHFYVPVTTINARTQTGANAVQGTTVGSTTTWAAMVDAGTGTGATTVNQAMAFKVFGTSTPLATRIGQTGPGGLSIQAGPTPATDVLQVQLDNLNGSAKLLLTDASGRTIWTGTMPAGSSSTMVPVASIAAGVYLLEARSEAGSVRARILKE
jgi:hypothetical protein